MGFTDWFKKGWENYKSNMWTYVGLILIAAFVFAVMLLASTFSVANALKSAMDGLGAKSILTVLSHLTIGVLLFLVVGSLAGIYFQAALLYTASEENVSIKDALSSAKDMLLPLIGVIILVNVATGLPATLFFVADMLANTNGVLTAIGVLISVFVNIKLVTATGRIVLGEGVVEAVRNAWRTSFVDSLLVIVAGFLVGLLGLVVLMVPILGILVWGFVIIPWSIALYMAAVKELSQ